MSSKRKPRSRPNATGRSEYGRFVQLQYWLLDSSAYLALRPISRALLIEVARRFNGYNNGAIGFGERDAVERLGLTDRRAVRRAFADLESAGFIAKTRAGGFNLKARGEHRASEWRMTWLPTDTVPATKDFMHNPGPSKSTGEVYA